jgi:hypothetical protein
MIYSRRRAMLARHHCREEPEAMWTLCPRPLFEAGL